MTPIEKIFNTIAVTDGLDQEKLRDVAPLSEPLDVSDYIDDKLSRYFNN